MNTTSTHDTYQGSELYNQSLVDPDNRRPVDFALLRTVLAEVRRRYATEPSIFARELLGRYQDGAIKLLVVHAALQARRAAPELFRRGDYEALDGGRHVVAFTRTFGVEQLLCCAARHSYLKTRGEQPFAVADVWGDERLRIPRAGSYRNVITQRRVVVRKDARLADIFADLPVALLVRDRKSR